MHNLFLILALVVLATGFALWAMARPYRTAYYRNLAWHRQFVPRWRIHECYEGRGTAFASMSSSLLALGGLLVLMGLLVR